MAEKELQSICHEMRRQWPTVMFIAMLHRLGVVPIKEASVIIAVSSPHRQESLDAVQYGIDALKARVPIWKVETYEGTKDHVWKENAEWRCKQKTISTRQNEDGRRTP
jgi:molybdopterin synthase catalytic subunit